MTASIYGDRALDVALAEALGWEWHAIDGPKGRLRMICEPGCRTSFPVCDSSRDLAFGWAADLPRYSTDPAAYMMLLEEMERRGWSYRIHGGMDVEPAVKMWNIAIDVTEQPDEVFCRSLGEAICRAVLAALEVS